MSRLLPSAVFIAIILVMVAYPDIAAKVLGIIVAFVAPGSGGVSGR